jgi:hypothetical protein
VRGTYPVLLRFGRFVVRPALRPAATLPGGDRGAVVPELVTLRFGLATMTGLPGKSEEDERSLAVIVRKPGPISQGGNAGQGVRVTGLGLLGGGRQRCAPFPARSGRFASARRGRPVPGWSASMGAGACRVCSRPRQAKGEGEREKWLYSCSSSGNAIPCCLSHSRTIKSASHLTGRWFWRASAFSREYSIGS